LDYGNCNWLLPGADPADLCVACATNLVIPDLGWGDNLLLWTKMEHAKKRLLYTLLQVGLLSASGRAETWPLFRFMEDQRRNPNVAEEFVSTGHENGVITVNLAEADDVSRQAERQFLVERYRTVLGHLRHESGHYFFPRLTQAPGDMEVCRRVFGDEREGYDAALSDHYEAGPPEDWRERYVSAYASMHPREDFAESFAHYLLIVDALETATAAGLHTIAAGAGWVRRWVELSIALNELNRSLGADDAYPFTLAPATIEKLEVIRSLVARNAVPTAHPAS
jgi:hypothetical protein